jgi:hypothetical protein
MVQQILNIKGIYAGLSPADFAMIVRRPSLGAKLKATASVAGAATRGDRAGSAPQPNPIKA